jgi:Asp-tRNA(Asn)/Glu-tRNA(Gln) amidotransferase A subunit family amidase
VVDPECKAATEAAAKLCEELGHHVEEDMPKVSSADIGANFSPIWASGLTATVDLIAQTAGKVPTRDELEGVSWSLYQYGRTVTAAQYQLCGASLQRLSRQIAGWQQPYDRLDQAGPCKAADKDWHGRLRGDRSEESLGFHRPLRSVYGTAKHHRPARD